jgi:hypothetical protein
LLCSFLWAKHCLVVMLSIVEACSASSLYRGCLVTLVSCMGRNTGVPDCSASNTDYLHLGCSNSIVGVVILPLILLLVLSGSATGILVGDRACIAGLGCLRNGDGYCSRSKVHSSCASDPPSPYASFRSCLFYQSGAKRWGKCGSSAGNTGG